GDALLIEVAGRLRGCIADTDVIARLGGEEYVVLLRNADDEPGATEAAETIMQRRLTTQASIGIALIQIGSDPETMMRNADTAMYIAKAQGKHRVVMFEPSMYESNVYRFNLHSDLQRALDRDELTIHFQPIVTLATQDVIGAEALVRWHHPTLGELSPDSFLAVAEQTGLIVAIDRLIMDKACEWLASVDASVPGLVPWVTVNVSPRSFHEPTLVESVKTALKQHHLAPSRLGIEITENLMVEQADRAIATLH